MSAYRALVAAVLLYGAHAWTPTAPQLETLERLQRRHLRHILGRKRPAPAERTCTHCERLGGAAAAETAAHIVFDCALYADLRPATPSCSPPPPEGQDPPERPALGAFLTGDHVPDGERPHWLRSVAQFAGACRRLARKAMDLPP